MMPSERESDGEREVKGEEGRYILRVEREG
jgi:hypothetical protein